MVGRYRLNLSAWKSSSNNTNIVYHFALFLKLIALCAPLNCWTRKLATNVNVNWKRKLATNLSLHSYVFLLDFFLQLLGFSCFEPFKQSVELLMRKTNCQLKKEKKGHQQQAACGDIAKFERAIALINESREICARDMKKLEEQNSELKKTLNEKELAISQLQVSSTIFCIFLKS